LRAVRRERDSLADPGAVHDAEAGHEPAIERAGDRAEGGADH